ncbi:unnamed protein product [Candida verbasci]|uniref:Uncharacterized protein n=1 Tax=Candida verbasci TaxID=1227364 RepID=A0A9W4U0L2_9ASCO|nr:unnamed protein product [Candida verbasci]
METATSSSSLRDLQISKLEKMLHLNKDGSPDLTLASKSEEIIWKVLILDSKSTQILSSILRVNDLLKCGITVHSLINSKRSNLPDVSVIYFIEPTIENIQIIIEDLKNDKYDSFFINFTSSINRSLLEEFAKSVSLIGKSHKIKQVYDQYLNYITTESNLFSINQPQIYYKFNSNTTSENEIHNLVNLISDGLLSLIISMDVIPIIRAQQNGPAEFVAKELDMKLREYLNNKTSTSQSTFTQRPVLILLDRNFDLSSMFSHSWIYQCMVNDVFQLRRNTIKLIKTNKDGKEIIKNYDVDPKDFFWSKYSQLPFPDVVENADFELNLYKQDAKEITNRTGISNLNDIDPNSNSTANIQQAVEKLPELTNRKSVLDMHMDILSNLINELQAKNLDKYFEIEQNTANTDSIKIQKEFLEILQSNSEKDSSLDKLRTFIILNLVVDIPKEYINKVTSIFKESYPSLDLAPLNYILKFKENSKLNITNIAIDANSQSNSHFSNESSSALLSGLSSKLYGLTEGKISEGLSSIASRIKNFIPEKKLTALTHIVESIMNPQGSNNRYLNITDDYLYLDPKSRGHSTKPKRQQYNDSIVFVVGGGNYLEYQNLQEWKQEQINKNISGGGNVIKSVTYGSTEILSPLEFLNECGRLGEN